MEKRNGCFEFVYFFAYFVRDGRERERERERGKKPLNFLRNFFYPRKQSGIAVGTPAFPFLPHPWVCRFDLVLVLLLLCLWVLGIC
jgi:hypothetical protein